MFDTLKLIYTQDEALELVSRYEKVYNEKITELEEENRKLNERIKFLEQCLDNKEKVNKSLREELEIWKLTAKDYAKQCGVDLDDNITVGKH